MQTCTCRCMHKRAHSRIYAHAYICIHNYCSNLFKFPFLNLFKVSRWSSLKFVHARTHARRRACRPAVAGPCARTHKRMQVQTHARKHARARARRRAVPGTQSRGHAGTQARGETGNQARMHARTHVCMHARMHLCMYLSWNVSWNYTGFTAIHSIENISNL